MNSLMEDKVHIFSSLYLKRETSSGHVIKAVTVFAHWIFKQVYLFPK